VFPKKFPDPLSPRRIETYTPRPSLFSSGAFFFFPPRIWPPKESFQFPFGIPLFFPDSFFHESFYSCFNSERPMFPIDPAPLRISARLFALRRNYFLLSGWTLTPPPPSPHPPYPHPPPHPPPPFRLSTPCAERREGSPTFLLSREWSVRERSLARLGPNSRPPSPVGFAAPSLLVF